MRAKNLKGAEIDEAPQYAEGFFGPLQLDLDEIAELPNQTQDFLAKEQVVALNLRTEKRALLVAGKECEDIAQRAADVGRHFEQGFPECALGIAALNHDDPIEIDRVQLVGLGGKVG